jgi:hypothetical protein
MCDALFLMANAEMLLDRRAGPDILYFCAVSNGSQSDACRSPGFLPLVIFAFLERSHSFED